VTALRNYAERLFSASSYTRLSVNRYKRNSFALIRKQTILTKRPPFVGEISAIFRGYRRMRGQCNGSPWPLISVFYTHSHYFSIQIASQLYSRGWVDPVPHPSLLRKSGSAGNWTRDLWICSQELWSLDHRGGSLPRSTLHICPCECPESITLSVILPSSSSKSLQRY
jgi:hypothetical protein